MKTGNLHVLPLIALTTINFSIGIWYKVPADYVTKCYFEAFSFNENKNAMKNKRRQ